VAPMRMKSANPASAAGRFTLESTSRPMRSF
jgi:hypothetical protein